MPVIGRWSGSRAAGLRGVITQNVDGLHQAAGSQHGDQPARRHRQRDLPGLRRTRVRGGTCSAGWPSSIPSCDEPARLEHAELRPDGDAVVEDWHDFVLADCAACGGRLKPDVVFFGESVPRPRVERRVRAGRRRGGAGGARLVADRDVRAALRPAQRQAGRAGA